MSIVSLELRNPSAGAPLHISTQQRQIPPIEPEAPRAVHDPNATITPETRARYAKIGEAMVKHTDRHGHERTEPRWAADGCLSLAQWITRAFELQDSPTPSAPRGVRVLDAWQEPRPADAVAPHGIVALRLTNNERFLIECTDGEAVLQFSNPSSTNSIRLRQRDSKGRITNVAILSPGGAGTITAAGKTGAIVELIPC
jgi:hypothetical protein